MPGFLHVAGWLIGRRRRFRIVGDSMTPTLCHGDHVLVDPNAFVRRRPLAGDVVVARHPFKRGVTVVKRVARVDGSGRCFLVGDNPYETSDSHSFGAVAAHNLTGRVVYRMQGAR